MNFFRSAARYAHGDLIEIGGAPVRLRVDGRARRVSIRIDAAKGEVVATAPTPRSLADAVAFAGTRADWIAKRIAKRPSAISLEPGQTLTVLGRPCHLEAATGRGRLVEDEAGIRVLAPAGDRFAPTVLRLLKAEARRVLAERTAHHALAYGQPLPKVGLGDPRSRWGSCTQPRKRGFGSEARVGSIRYSWRLILAPYDVLDYVAAHECAHLVEGNHGPDFWALVEAQVPDWKVHRRWLRTHGETLHAVGA